MRASGGPVPPVADCISTFATLATLSKFMSIDGELAIGLRNQRQRQIHANVLVHGSAFKSTVELV